MDPLEIWEEILLFVAYLFMVLLIWFWLTGGGPGYWLWRLIYWF